LPGGTAEIIKFRFLLVVNDERNSMDLGAESPPRNSYACKPEIPSPDEFHIISWKARKVQSPNLGRYTSVN